MAGIGKCAAHAKNTALRLQYDAALAKVENPRSVLSASRSLRRGAANDRRRHPPVL